MTSSGGTPRSRLTEIRIETRVIDFLVCTGCYWIAEFGSSDLGHGCSFGSKRERRSYRICNGCGSRVDHVRLPIGHREEYLYWRNRRDNRRCINWAGWTSERTAKWLLGYPCEVCTLDQNDLSWWTRNR